MFNQFWNYVQNLFSTVLHHLLKLHVSVILFDFSTAPYRWVKFKSRMGTSTCMRKAGWWHALHMFAESFQGQYKDRTSDPCDFRMVSASFLILQDINHSPIFASTQDDACLLFIKTAVCIICMCYWFLCYCKAIQVEYKGYFDPSFAGNNITYILLDST